MRFAIRIGAVFVMIGFGGGAASASIPPTVPPATTEFVAWSAHLAAVGVEAGPNASACAEPVEVDGVTVAVSCYATSGGVALFAVGTFGADGVWTFGPGGTSEPVAGDAAIVRSAEEAWSVWTMGQGLDVSAPSCATAGGPGTSEIVAICYGLADGVVAAGSSSVDGGVTWGPFDTI